MMRNRYEDNDDRMRRYRSNDDYENRPVRGQPGYDETRTSRYGNTDEDRSYGRDNSMGSRNSGDPWSQRDQDGLHAVGRDRYEDSMHTAQWGGHDDYQGQYGSGRSGSGAWQSQQNGGRSGYESRSGGLYAGQGEYGNNQPYQRDYGQEGQQHWGQSGGHQGRGNRVQAGQSGYGQGNYGYASGHDQWGQTGHHGDHGQGSRRGQDTYSAPSGFGQTGSGLGMTGSGYGQFGQNSQGQGYQGGQSGSVAHLGDPDYHDWRERTMKKHDEDFQAFRASRQKKFDDEFEQWRKNRNDQSSSGSAQSGAGESTYGGSSGLSAQQSQSGKSDDSSSGKKG